MASKRFVINVTTPQAGILAEALNEGLKIIDPARLEGENALLRMIPANLRKLVRSIQDEETDIYALANTASNEPQVGLSVCPTTDQNTPGAPPAV